TFRRLCDCAESPTADRGLLTLFEEPTAIASWLTRWRQRLGAEGRAGSLVAAGMQQDRKSTRLNSSHVKISYAVFCLKKKTCEPQRSYAPHWLRPIRRVASIEAPRQRA